MGTDPNPELPLDPDLPAETAQATSPFGARVRARPDYDVVAVVAAGGALGGAARYGLNVWLPTANGGFPWSTFVENVLGCFLLGALMVFLLDVWRPSRYLRPFLGVGVLGGFTTFSAYTNDIRSLVADREVPLALAYLFGTLLLAVAATWAGITVARLVSGTAPRRIRWRST